MRHLRRKPRTTRRMFTLQLHDRPLAPPVPPSHVEPRGRNAAHVYDHLDGHALLCTFTLQLGDGGEAHFHRCEMCYRDKPCGYIDCREPRIDTCEECIHSHDCPRCGAQMELTWDSDYLDEHGNETRTNFAATCTCGAVACFVDLHDGRGPLRKQIEPRVGNLLSTEDEA